MKNCWKSVAPCLFILAFGLVGACNSGQAGQHDNAQATIAALSTENARLAQAVATSVPASAAPAIAVSDPVSATQPVASTALLTATKPLTDLTNLIPAAGPLPQVLAEIALAPVGATLIDFRLDPAANRLYVTDSANHLYVLDAATRAILATLPVGGELTLDAVHQRLYVAPGDSVYQETPAIAVVDTDALTITALITNASHLALDVAQNRLFVGSRFSASTPSDAPGVRILAADSLAQTAEIAQPGIPIYNPLRNELLIVAYTIYAADPESGEITGDLLPELAEQSPRWCNGCSYAVDATVFADENLVLFDVQPIAAGKGAGYYPPPRFVDAAMLAPIALVASPEIQPSCGSQPQMQGAVDGRIYRHRFYDRYVFYNNVEVYDLDGNLLTWRDGLSKPFINARTNQAYANGWALDLASLTPLGPMPSICPFLHDNATGTLYGSRQGTLVVLAETGGALPAVKPVAPARLPAATIHEIVVSPDYANHALLFVQTADGLYRSRDDGGTWTFLRQGAPHMDVAISPAFASDQTLFIGAYHGESRGEGVLRSTDGGTTWQPLWNGLTYLRIAEITLSPAFASDQTLLAYGPYTRIDPWQTGFAVQRSTDGGLAWSTVLTASVETELPTPAALLATAAEPLLP
ncbi:MAG: hypothetical protein M3Q45_12285, partial [Chloroflexota bacterium]|nr:hypothetical protein [Chloroflexota bacterium]